MQLPFRIANGRLAQIKEKAAVQARTQSCARSERTMCVSRVYIYIYIPGLHTASLLGVPLSFTPLSAQVLCLAHSVLASCLALNVPSGQGSHVGIDILRQLTNKLSWTSFLPAGHFATARNTTHGVIRRNRKGCNGFAAAFHNGKW